MDHFPKALSTPGLLVFLSLFVLRTEFPSHFIPVIYVGYTFAALFFSPWTTWDFSLTCPFAVSKSFAPCLGSTTTTISTTLVLSKIPRSGRAPVLSQRELDSAPDWDIWVSASMCESDVRVPATVKKEPTNGSVQLPTCRYLVPFEGPRGVSLDLQLMLQEDLGLPYLLHHTCQFWSRMSPLPWGISGGSRHSEATSSPEYSAISFGRSRVRPPVHIPMYLLPMLVLGMDKICSP